MNSDPNRAQCSALSQVCCVYVLTMRAMHVVARAKRSITAHLATPVPKPCRDTKFSVATYFLKFSVAIENSPSRQRRLGFPVATPFPCRDPASKGPCRNREPPSRPWSPNPSSNPIATQKSCHDARSGIHVTRASPPCPQSCREPNPCALSRHNVQGALSRQRLENGQ